MNYNDLYSDSALVMTEQDKQFLNNELDNMPFFMIKAMYELPLVIKKYDYGAGSTVGGSYHDKVLLLSKNSFTAGNDAFLHESIHALDDYCKRAFGIALRDTKVFTEIFNKEGDLISLTNARGNKIEYIAYTLAGYKKNPNASFFNNIPLTKQFCKEFYDLGLEFTFENEITNLRINKIDDIQVNTNDLTLTFFKDGLTKVIPLPAGGAGGVIIDNTLDENTNIQDFRANVITYSYKNNDGVAASILLSTYVSPLKDDFFQIKYEIGGQLNAPCKMLVRSGTRYGWEAWQEIGGSGGSSGGSGSLPIASASTLGGIKVGSDLAIDAAGTLNATHRNQSELDGITTVAITNWNNANYHSLIQGMNFSNNTVNMNSKNGVQRLTNPITANFTINLPTDTTRSPYSLVFKTGAASPTFTINPIPKYQNGEKPTLEPNSYYEFVFMYIIDTWVGGLIKYA